MTFFDVLVLISLAYSTASGAMTGLVRSLSTTVGVVVGLMLALVFYREAAQFFRMIGFSEVTALCLGMISPMVLALAASAVLSYSLREVLKKLGLTVLDRVGGGALGLARAVLFWSLIYLAFTAFPIRLQFIEGAQTGPILKAGAQVLAFISSQDVEKRFDQGVAELRKLKAGLSSTPPKEKAPQPDSKERR